MSLKKMREHFCHCGALLLIKQHLLRILDCAGTLHTVTCLLPAMDPVFLIFLLDNIKTLCLDNMYKQGESGVVCIFSLKNPSYPEYQCWASAGVMCLDFHPQHPHMLCAGLYDGNIAVYNLQRDCVRPAYQSHANNGKHRDSVWHVRESLLFTSLSW